MLNEPVSKVKEWLADNKSDAIIVMIFFLAIITSFGLGRLSVLVENRRKEPIRIEHQTNQETVNENLDGRPSADSSRGERSDANNRVRQSAMLYVGSKNSNKYHLPDCPGALRIKEENKIWFSSREEAEDLGYTPASNCAGL